MLKKVFTFLLCSSMLLACSASLQKNKDSERSDEAIRKVHSNCEFQDSGEVIFNPDMGFYSVIKAIVTKDGITIEDGYKSRLEKHNPISSLL